VSIEYELRNRCVYAMPLIASSREDHETLSHKTETFRAERLEA